MKLKVLKGLPVFVVALTIAIVTLKIYMLAVTRKLPWQRPVFDSQLPAEPMDVGMAGVLIYS